MKHILYRTGEPHARMESSPSEEIYNFFFHHKDDKNRNDELFKGAGGVWEDLELRNEKVASISLSPEFTVRYLERCRVHQHVVEAGFKDCSWTRDAKDGEWKKSTE